MQRYPIRNSAASMTLVHLTFMVMAVTVGVAVVVIEDFSIMTFLFMTQTYVLSDARTLSLSLSANYVIVC